MVRHKPHPTRWPEDPVRPWRHNRQICETSLETSHSSKPHILTAPGCQPTQKTKANSALWSTLDSRGQTAGRDLSPPPWGLQSLPSVRTLAHRIRLYPDRWFKFKKIFRPFRVMFKHHFMPCKYQNTNWRFVQRVQETRHSIDALMGMVEVVQVVNTSSFMNVIGKFYIYD